MHRYDPTTALIVVDLQNDFADSRGGLSVSGGDRIVPVINAEIEAAVAAGAPVVYTQDWHPPSTPHFEKDGGVWPVHCVRDTWGADFHPSLRVVGPSIRKGSNGEDGYCGFWMRDAVTGETVPTELEGWLRERGVEQVVICGLATDYCVRETGLAAAELGFGTFVLADAVAAVDVQPGDGDRALGELRAAGVAIEAAAVPVPDR